MTGTLVLNKKPLSIKKQTLAAILAIITAVALPQLFHLLGLATGTGKILGVLFSPMHLPIIFVGLIAGPYAGAISGLLGPAASALLTGMPHGLSLPLMMTELFGYGLAAGLLRNVNISNILKVLIVQIAGRFLRMLGCFALVYVFAKSGVELFGAWTGIARCWPGIILQIILIPVVMNTTFCKNDTNK